MNRKKKILLTLFLVFLLITILRETEVVTLDLYKSNINTSSNVDWNSIVVRPSLPVEESEQPLNESYLDIPIVVIFEGDTLYKDPGRFTPIKVSIEKINPGFLWTPIVKRGGFTASGLCSYDGAILFPKRKEQKADYLKLEGPFQMKGNISVLGICSRATALQKIKDFIVSDIRMQIKKRLASLDDDGLNYGKENK